MKRQIKTSTQLDTRLAMQLRNAGYTRSEIKYIEDMMACGRTLDSVLNDLTDTSCPTTSPESDSTVHECFVRMHNRGPFVESHPISDSTLACMHKIQETPHYTLYGLFDHIYKVMK